MKKSNSQKISLGLFIVIGTLLLISILYFIGNRQNIFGKTFNVSAVFNNVNGLQLGNNVRYSGINIGTVKRITMQNDTAICVDMILEYKILKHIKKNAIAAIGSDGLVGSMVINIVPNHKASTQLKPGDTIKTYSRITTTDILSTLNSTNENAALLVSDLLKITSSITQGKGTLGLLITDQEMASNLKKTSSNLKSMSLNASKSMEEIKNIITAINYDKSLAGLILSDTVSAIQFKAIITNLEQSSEGIDTVVLKIKEVLLNATNGPGAINYFLKDSTFVEKIDSTMKNLEKGSIKLNENLEALKHNFLTRGYFKKLERQKAKEEKNKK
ncbi:MlaD family protein [Lutibacter citreus]|uniref:MlaD family protein n=1 Tax=Lutibacter citreus TaxID=2138210 RepID=UPI000DBEAA4E|nr:MlaD family protein [Lutibacter citreus]